MSSNQIIKICFVIDTINSPGAGTEKQLLMLLDHIDKNRFEPFLVVLRNSMWLDKYYHGAPLKNLDVVSLKNLKGIRGLLDLITFVRRESIDIVQTFFIDGNKIGVVAGWLGGAKGIISSRRNQGFWHNRVERMILKVLNKGVDCFIANSYSTCYWAQKAESIPAEKIEVIYNGIDLDLYRPKGSDEIRDEYRRELGISDETIAIGIVANLRAIKDHETFLVAAKNIAEKIKTTHFLVIGEGECREKLQAYAATIGLAKKVSFLGSRLDIPQLLTAFDIGILSSKSESFSNALMEYMAACLPVVTTDVGGAREAIENGVNGYVVPVGDVKALTDAVLDIIICNRFASMGEAGRKRAELLFSRACMIEQHESLYARLAHGNKEQKLC